MRTIIKKVRGGFRLWSTICDVYVTDVLKEDELVEVLKEQAVAAGAALTKELTEEIPERIARTKKNGSSSHL